MQWCLHIRDHLDLERELDLYAVSDLKSSSGLHARAAEACRLMIASLGPMSFERIYFGAEFCEQLLPRSYELIRVLRAVEARNLKFTLLTPYVSNAGLRRVRALLAIVRDHGEHEVVFSDWGVLDLLRGEFPRLLPVQGRLLNKSLRDPRIAHAFTQLPSTAAGPAPALVAIQHSNLDSPAYLEFLRKRGVRMVEIDNVPQGSDVSWGAHGMAVSVPFPFGIVSTGRVCMAAGLGLPKARKFQPGAACRQQCQDFVAEFSFPNAVAGGAPGRVYLQGNSYFYFHDDDMLRAFAEQVRKGLIARAVFQPRLPMLSTLLAATAPATLEPLLGAAGVAPQTATTEAG